LSPNSDLVLALNSSSEPQQILQSRKRLLDENDTVANLYYGSVVYQLVCDWTGRKYNKRNKIPGLGSLGSSDLEANVARSVIEQHIRIAKEAGAIGNLESALFRWVLPLIRNIANVRPSVN